MGEDDLDRALSREHDIVPSSGFVNAVMAAVRAEAEAPAPIPFPWGRALSGATLATITAIVVPLMLSFQPGRLPSPPPAGLQSALDLALRLGLNRDVWAVTASLLITAVTVVAPRRLFVRTR